MPVNERPKRQRTPAKVYGDVLNTNLIGHYLNPSKRIKTSTSADASSSSPSPSSVNDRPKRQHRPSKMYGDVFNVNLIGPLLPPPKIESVSKNSTTTKNNSNESGKRKPGKINIDQKNPMINGCVSEKVKRENGKRITSTSEKVNQPTKNKKTKMPVTPAKTPTRVSKIAPKKKKPPTAKKPPKTPGEALEQALVRLHSSSVPDSLPCRDKQFEDIYNFCSRKLSTDEGGCMYISGVPGTGKTATLREVKRQLELDGARQPPFRWIEINGLRLAQPHRFGSHFLMELEGVKKSSHQAMDTLSQRFTDPKRKKEFVILFIDELDYLRTKKQEVLYHIFDWPNHPGSKLIVLAVANSMDLPERLMVNRVSSRLGLTRLLFQPYSHKELEQIVNARLCDMAHEVFEPDALQLICRKVSAVSGDARRVLDIGRRAVEISIENRHEQVTMPDVSKALQEIFHSIKTARIMQASIQEQIFLRAFLQNFRNSGLEEYQFIEIYHSHVALCQLEGQPVPNTVELSKMATNLDLSKIILLERSHSHIYRRIRLNVSPDDVAYALNLES